MARESSRSAAEKTLMGVLDATVRALNAREAGNTRIQIEMPDISRFHNNPVIEHAYTELKGVLAGALPVPIERRPDIEPFFLA